MISVFVIVFTNFIGYNFNFVNRYRLINPYLPTPVNIIVIFTVYKRVIINLKNYLSIALRFLNICSQICTSIGTKSSYSK